MQVKSRVRGYNPCGKFELNDIKTISEPPSFVYGDFVSPVNRPDIIGKIETLIWHFKDKDYNYYISVNEKKKSKRYFAEDLMIIRHRDGHSSH